MASMSDKSRRLVDGEGVNRVIDTIISIVDNRKIYEFTLK
jgi:hypothetical protein